MIFAKYFYPKELKEAIADLRAKDDLNEESLCRVNRDITKKYIAILSIILVLIVCSLLGNETFIFIFLLSIILAMSVLLDITNKYTLPYTIGIMVDASVTGANYEKIPFHGYSGWSVRYEYTVNSEKYNGSSVGIESADVKGGNIKVGDTLKVFYLPHNPSISVPFLPSKHKLFSLRNKRI